MEGMVARSRNFSRRAQSITFSIETEMFTKYNFARDPLGFCEVHFVFGFLIHPAELSTGGTFSRAVSGSLSEELRAARVHSVQRWHQDTDGFFPTFEPQRVEAKG
jgi:hypothetical protein